MERKKQIEIEEQEINRKEKELVSTVKLPAEAESYRLETIAQGKRTQVRILIIVKIDRLLRCLYTSLVARYRFKYIYTLVAGYCVLVVVTWLM